MSYWTVWLIFRDFGNGIRRKQSIESLMKKSFLRWKLKDNIDEKLGKFLEIF